MTASPSESPLVSVVIPVFNEAETIGALVDRLVSALSEDVGSFEIVLVDDGSTDNTHGALRAAASRHPQTVRGARHLENRGNGASLRTGIRIAAGEIVVTMDADGQHDPRDIATLLAEIPPNDLVVGARTSDYVGPWSRGMANRFFNWFASYLSRREVKDLTSGFRAMRRQIVLHFLPLFPEGFSAPTTTTLSFLKAGYNVTFVPIDVAERAGGQSKIRPWRDGVLFIGVILRMIMLYDPMRIFMPTSVALAVVGGLAWIAGLVNAGRLVFPNSAIFLFSGSLTTMLLGLVSSQVAGAQLHYYGDETIVMVDGSSAEGDQSESPET
jgi:glycosyltransferase involved in cell wall biosynthesis